LIPEDVRKKSALAPRNAQKLSSKEQMTAMMLDEIEPSDLDLIGLAQKGDGAAFGRLVERHYDFIHRVAWRWSGRKADAEDIAQEVCVRLGRAICTYRGGGAFTTWLYAMTMNAARDAMRRKARETAKAEAFGVHALIGGQGQAEADERAEELWTAVRELPDKQRDAVLLVYGEGLAHAAAADVMACAEATVSWHIHEAKKRLKALLSVGEV
jgi:RNA polymerase sigma-70 factor (ECF subfamily)